MGAGCFALIVFFQSCCYYGSVSLPRGAWVGLWSVSVIFLGHTHLFFEEIK